VPTIESSHAREKKICAWLDSVKHDAAEIFLVGDIFDFWYEYKTVVPKGYVRLLGKLAELTDSGIKIHFFIGNHDMWMSGYFEQELNIPVYSAPKIFEWNGKSFYTGHGDGLGPGDHKYKFIKSIFRSKFCKWVFGLMHPNMGIGLANYLSGKSRKKSMPKDRVFLGEDREFLIIFCRQVLAKEHYDFFVFGHRHYPLDFRLNSKSRYINLGDWMQYFTYAVFDGNDMQLKKWEE